ncbi:hypothetical protein AB0F77_15465 [Streptomyces sp. NPDC026672]|uniref:hypothetical protein n=1 Tax=unclassified Streptomyces TaxID=2593676 RepID=UPI0033E0F10F
MNVRLPLLAGLAVLALALLLAVASAGSGEDGGRPAVRRSAQIPAGEPAYGTSYDGTSRGAQDGRNSSPAAPGRDRHQDPVPVTTARCGPELSSPEGVEAQTCVLARGGTTWARAYYRNTSGRTLESVLSLMGPGGRSVRLDCPVSADDEPGACETPRERSRAVLGAYTAVTEFVSRGGAGPLLLRSGSDAERGNSEAFDGS